MIAVTFHVLMDLPTSYGTRTLSPFTWTWFAEDWEPIVDIYLLAILGAGLWFGQFRTANRSASKSSWLTQARMRNAVIALALMVVNYGVRAAAHHEALLEHPGSSVRIATAVRRCRSHRLADGLLATDLESGTRRSPRPVSHRTRGDAGFPVAGFVGA